MDAVEFLEHYGTRGMKWGVRKDRGGGVSRTAPSQHTSSRTESKPAPSAPLKGHHIFSKKLAKKSKTKDEVESEDAKAYRELHEKAKRTGRSSLTNAELKKLNERFDMEKKFSKLEAEMKAKKSGVGKKIAKKVAENMAERAVSSLVGHVVDAHVEKFKTGSTVKRMLPKT